MPTGFWGFLEATIKDRAPTQVITVQDVMSIYKEFQQSGGGDEEDAGIFGLMKTLITNQDKGMTLADVTALLDRADKKQAPQAPGQQVMDMTNSFTTAMSTLLTSVTNLLSQQIQKSTNIELPGGQSVSMEALDKWMNLQLKLDSHRETKANLQAFRHNLPLGIATLAKWAEAVKGQGTSPPPPGPAAEGEQSEEEKFQRFTCPECNLPFVVPAGEITDEEAACPRCAPKYLKEMQERLKEVGDAAKSGEGAQSGSGGGKETSGRRMGKQQSQAVP